MWSNNTDSDSSSQNSSQADFFDGDDFQTIMQETAKFFEFENDDNHVRFESELNAEDSLHELVNGDSKNQGDIVNNFEEGTDPEDLNVMGYHCDLMKIPCLGPVICPARYPSQNHKVLDGEGRNADVGDVRTCLLVNGQNGIGLPQHNSANHISDAAETQMKGDRSDGLMEQREPNSPTDLASPIDVAEGVNLSWAGRE
ncbi:hypothetical protein SESBI_47886 [Sesbania bispinosa]|nr:hypothetical protein SESBI_47886 [Sesbania bispinosa]